MMRSPILSENCRLIRTEFGNELIPYDDTLTKAGVAKEFKRLQAAFPQLEKNFYQVLMDRITENGYTDKQLHDAINHVIDNCMYPVPVIANVMSFKNKIKLYSYSDICNKVENMGRVVWNEYKPINVPGIDAKVWVSVIDYEKYKLS